LWRFGTATFLFKFSEKTNALPVRFPELPSWVYYYLFGLVAAMILALVARPCALKVAVKSRRMRRTYLQAVLEVPRIMKSKPWTVEEEDMLRQPPKAKRSARTISRVMGKSRDYVSMKIARLGLEVVTSANSAVTTTTLQICLFPKSCQA